MMILKTALVTGAMAASALALPLAASAQAATSTAPVAAHQGSASITAEVGTTTASYAKPKPNYKQKQYNKGYHAGYTDGRSDCKNKKPYDLNGSGWGPYLRGFIDGYNAGFHSCKA
ncbi:hypothetical protein [Thermoactinospora rubra]|uniref:hypothetical protein n=1 Tax=Thermoactinospora rubra TaxID=1088767 RepID=UPI000A0F5BC3|nr:hypothetical protein [Thermoactinospora rubra]